MALERIVCLAKEKKKEKIGEEKSLRVRPRDHYKMFISIQYQRRLLHRCMAKYTLPQINLNQKAVHLGARKTFPAPPQRIAHHTYGKRLSWIHAWVLEGCHRDDLCQVVL
jgi:hypothetical protein